MLAAVAATVIAVTMIVAQQQPTGTLTTHPSVAPSTAPSPSFDPADFRPQRIAAPASQSEQPGDGPLLPEAPDIVVITSDAREIRAYDLATGDQRRAPQNVTDQMFWYGPWQPFAVGGQVVLNEAGDVVLIEGHELRRMRLARDHVALHTVDDDAVWVLDNGLPGAQTALQVALDGTVTSRVAVPPMASAEVGTPDGVLASSPSGLHLISEADTRLITPAGALIAVSPDRIAWLGCDGDLACQVRIGTLDDPDQVRVPVDAAERPGGLGGSVGRFSPDGRHLAYPIYTMHEADGLVATAVSVVDARVGAEVDRIETTRPSELNELALDWSPDGRWLFTSVDGLHAWDARSHDVTLLDRRRTSLFGVVAVPG